MTAPALPPAAMPATGRRRPRLRAGGALSAAWLVVLLLASLTAPLWEPYPADDQDSLHTLAGPSGSHWLGTDQLGRDVLTRIAAGGWISVGPGMLAVVVAFGIGIPLALVAAEHGRWVERGSSRFAELLLALPALIILLAFVGAVGVHMWAIMTVLGVLLSAPVYRIFLGQAQSVRTLLYVDAARVNGVSSLRVNLRHVLPAMATTIAVQAAQLFAIGVLIEAGLAFMGFGPKVPTPSWGGLIADASQNVYTDPWLMVPTGLVLALTVVAANVLADTVQAGTGQAGPGQGDTGEGERERKRASAAPRGRRRPGGPAAGTDTLLDVRDLTVAVADGPGLVTVSFALRPGTVLGLVGESGCGKTMTARALPGLLPDGVRVTGGSARFGGRDLAVLPEKELRALRGRDIAMISQEPMVALDPVFSIGYQLTQPIRRFRGVGQHGVRGSRVGRAEARRIAAELLAQVGITDPRRVLRSYPHQLSGGMAQRVCIALALTGSPRLLIADEPTTALDVTVQAEILSLLRALVRDTGLAVLIVSHDLGVVADLCDDVAVMYAGQVVESGTVTEVLGRPSHPYTAALLAANPHVADGLPVPDRLPSIPGTVPAPADWPAGCRFAGRCALATEECALPVPVTPAHRGGSLRCVHPLAAPVELPMPRTVEPGVTS
jgi:peptide/nickel transport system permease protein